MLEIRKAKAFDSRGIIEVNVKTWCTTYEGTVPSDYLKHRVDTMEEKIKICEQTIEKDDNVFIALKDGNIVGVMSYGPCKNEVYKNYGEIYSLYVLKEYQRQSIGRKLFLKGIEELKNKSYENVIWDEVYRQAMTEFLGTGIFPATIGVQCNGDPFNARYAVQDIDGDGREELLLNFEKKTVAAFTNSIFRKDIPLLRTGR